ncbi:hypothetical protein PTT65_04155 [Serratia ureilytica]|uniref:hypothetical protein n=1 Tax=Serratia ureilytica TaxID=300181 RepID=UPI00313E99A5
MLTTEQLSQIKADISARKAMPEYGESIEGNIERLRVIGATRSHFSTEAVEMLVRALEEQSRALADAERERDDWVEHSRRMEHRAIEAKELLANRKAQPVLYASEETLAYAKEGEKSLVTWSEPMGDAVIPLFTAPPAPEVPDAIPEVDRGEGGSDIDYMQPKEIYDMGKTDGWNACRAAMLAAAPPISASDFVNGYCERTGITIDEFYESQVPMPDSTSPRGWAAVSNKPMTIKAHVELYATPQPIAPDGKN